MPPELVMIFVEQENTVFYPDNDQQRRYNPCKDGNLVAENTKGAHGPDYTDEYDEHREQHRFE
ncbi:hypothetical protein DSECCO2_570040 [anaerobic digester metagenome]